MKKDWRTSSSKLMLLLAIMNDTSALSPHPCKKRRQLVLGQSVWLALGWPGSSCHAAETIGKDPTCNQGNCLGVWDGLLADCPHGTFTSVVGGGAGCVSSQDDTPGIFSEPWDYSESDTLNWEIQMKRLIPALQLIANRRKEQLQIELQEGRYLRVLFTDGGRDTSIGEFYFTPNDTTIQFRLASSTGFASKLRNMDRAELIRKELRYLKLPVLRNRQRSLFFVESELDTFGPGSAALGPPAEMNTGEMEGRQDVDTKLKIDLIQQFPFK